MSFSGKVKEELAGKLPRARHCQLAELAALIEISGKISDRGEGSSGLSFHTENLSVARKCFTLLEKTFNIKADVSVRRYFASRNASYRIRVPDGKETLRILQATRMIDTGSDSAANTQTFDSLIIQQPCCRRAFLRGAFLAAGSMSDPQKAYHLEFVCADEKIARQLQGIMSTFSMEAKIVIRKRMHVVYLKEGSQIVDMLNIMGACVSLMEVENVRILKEMRNSVNRKVNCETANIHKTVSASVRQVEDIEFIRRTVGLDKLPANLREMAEVRLEHPDAALKELGGLLDPPVGKSGVNHRLRKITEIADDIRMNKEELL